MFGLLLAFAASQASAAAPSVPPLRYLPTSQASIYSVGSETAWKAATSVLDRLKIESTIDGDDPRVYLASVLDVETNAPRALRSFRFNGVIEEWFLEKLEELLRFRPARLDGCFVSARLRYRLTYRIR